MRYIIFLMTCLLLLAPAGVALADSAPMQTVGPHVQPMDSTTVRLESERIDIRLREDRRDAAVSAFSGVADYRIQFHFVPTADEKMTAGFPLFVWDPKKNIYGAHLQDFRVYAGGQELATSLKGGFMDGTNVDWAIFDLTFEAGKPLDLEVTYSMEAVPYGKTWASDLWISYVLRTGAFWAGTIGHAEAHLTMDRPVRAEDIRSGEGLWRSTTPGWRLEDGALHWVWQEVEPDFDLSVVMANAFWLDSPEALGALVAKGDLDRAGCLKLVLGMMVYFEGDARAGIRMPLRGGKNTGDAAEALWPDAVPVLQGCVDQAPKDEELRTWYMRLLSVSAWHWENGVTSQVSEERFRIHLREYRAYKEALGRAPGGSTVPWLGTEITGLKLSAETQAEVAAFLVAEEMSSSFSTEKAARDWVAKAAKPLGEQATEVLLKEALARVKPAPDPGPQAPGPGATPAPPQGPGTGPGAAPAPPADPGPTPSPTPWLWIGGTALLALGAAAVLVRKRSAVPKENAPPSHGQK